MDGGLAPPDYPERPGPPCAIAPRPPGPHRHAPIPPARAGVEMGGGLAPPDYPERPGPPCDIARRVLGPNPHAMLPVRKPTRRTGEPVGGLVVGKGLFGTVDVELYAGAETLAAAGAR